jgi:hypothetical protein
MRRILLIAAILLFPSIAHAQIGNAFVVSSCGTPPSTYAPGTIRNTLVDANGNSCVIGTFTATITGTTSNAGSGVATGSANTPVVSYNYGFNGTTWDQLQVDGLKNLKVATTPQVSGATTQAAAAPTTPTFSSVLATSAVRKGCTVQNTGTTLGYVFFGANGSATTANSFQLTPGAVISCNNVNGTVLTDNVSATCASGTCAFIVGSQ